MPFVTVEQQQALIDLGVATLSPIFYQCYDQRTDEGDPVLLLLHGAGGSYLSWPPQLRRLPRALVYAIDLPGHGQSEPFTFNAGATLQIATYSALVHALIHTWQLDKVILIGHSMGGAIALASALTDQSAAATTLAGLVLIGSGATLPVNQRIFRGLENEFIATTAQLVDWMYAPGLPEKHRAQALKALRQNPLPLLLADFQACNDFDVATQIQQLRLPTLLICGDLDKMTPVASSQHLATAIPASRLEIIPERGHMVMLEAPKVVTATVTRFIDEQSSFRK